MKFSAASGADNSNEYRWKTVLNGFGETAVPADNGWTIADELDYRIGSGAWQSADDLAAYLSVRASAAPPPDPTLTAQRDEDGDSASITWTAYDGDGFQYYRVIVCDDSQYHGSYCDGTVFQSDPIYDASSTGPVSVADLDANTRYGVILQVWRDGGALKIHVTLPPAAPANLSVTPLETYTNSGLDLDIDWDAVDGATGYDIRAKSEGSSNWHDVASDVTTNSYRYLPTTEIATVANHTGAWSLKRTVPTGDDTCISGEADFSHALSNLTAGTTYTYTAYWVANCREYYEVESVTFKTPLARGVQHHVHVGRPDAQRTHRRLVVEADRALDGNLHGGRGRLLPRRQRPHRRNAVHLPGLRRLQLRQRA